MIKEILTYSNLESKNDLLLDFENPTNPVLERSGIGDESSEIRNPCIVEYDANTWVQFYIARSTTRREGIKFATSPKTDPHNWTKDGNLILSSRIGFWDDNISGCAVIKKDGIWYVFYNSWDEGKIGLATGSDLNSLVRYSDDPIIDNSALSTFDKYIRHPSIIKHQGVYYLFVETRANQATGVGFKDSNITYLTSIDLINWTRLGSPLFDNSLWDSYYYTMNMPTVKFYKGKFHLFCIATYVEAGISRTGGGVLYATAESVNDWQVKSHNYWALNKREMEYSWNAGNNQEPELFLIDDDNLFLYINGRNDLSEQASNGYYKLKLGSYKDVKPTPIIKEDFIGTTTPDNWNFNNGNGITVTQNNGLVIQADGTQDFSGHKAIEYDLPIKNIKYVAYSLAINYSVTPFNSTTGLSFELTDAKRQNGFWFARTSTTGKVKFKLRINNVDYLNVEYDILSDQIIKASKDGSQFAIYKDNSGLMEYLDDVLSVFFRDIELKFKVFIANKLGETTTVNLNQVTVLPYDFPVTNEYLNV